MQNKKIELDKSSFSKEILLTIKKNENILSATLVGSFTKKKKFNIKSDIDLVVIFKKLNKKIYWECINNVRKFNINKYTSLSTSIFINHSFGPLKFYHKDKITIHLMMYTIEEHFQHVINSPFTCYDWQRSNIFIGKRLKNIYPIKSLFLDDFIKTRRGVSKLLEDVQSNYISIQKKGFKNNKTYNYNIKKKLNKIDRFELSFSVIYNLINNFHKFRIQKNISPNKNQFKNLFLEITKSNFLYNEFLKLKKIKDSNNFIIENYLPLTEKFLKYFDKYLNTLNFSNIVFFRHSKTKFKSSIFLGQKINVNIIKKPDIKKFKKIKFNVFYSSTLKRAIETCEYFSSGNKIIKNKLLDEIDYGNAEGLDYAQLKENFNYIIKKWNQGGDPRFPDGENLNDVSKRVKKFILLLEHKLIKNKQENNILVVTHNVLLRSLIGLSLNLKRNEWYKINIKFNDSLNFIYYNNKIIPNFNRYKYFIE